MILAAVQAGPSIDITEAVIETGLLVAGLVAFIWQLRRTRLVPPVGVEPWRAGWLDFGLWLWVIYCAVFVGLRLLHFFNPALADTPAVGAAGSKTDLGVLLNGSVFQISCLGAQLGMLLTKRTWSPFPVNFALKSWAAIFGLAVLAWLAAYPLLIPADAAWQKILSVAEAHFHTLSAPTQETVKIAGRITDPLQISLMIFFAVIVAPINEELLFRAGFYRFFKGKLPRSVALVSVSLLFALSHYNLLTFFPLFVLGLLLARAYERSGHIAVPVLFHALFNLTTITLLLLFPEAAILPPS